MAQNSSTRIPGLDLMKVLGLYLVIIYHLTFRVVYDYEPGTLQAFMFYLPYSFLSICVPLFFTASGALSLNRPLNLRKNTLRCLHIGLLMIFWVFFSLFVILMIRRENPGLREFLAIAWDLRYGYIQHLWYLPLFLFLTIWLPLFHTLRNGPVKIYRYCLLVLGIFTFGNLLLNDGEYIFRWLLGKSASGKRYFFWYVDLFSYHYWYAPIYLALGAFLTANRQALNRRRHLAAAAIPVCLICLALAAVARTKTQGETFDPVFNNYGDPFTLILTASVSLFLIELSPGPLLQKFAQNISECSLGIYLIHWLIIEVLLNYLPAATSAAGVPFAPLTAIPIFLLSWGLTRGCLSIPFVRNLFTAAPAWIHSL